MRRQWVACASTNDAGIEVLRGPRDYKAVRQALAQAGYNGESIVVVAPTDVQPIRALGLAGTDQLQRAGMNVDMQEMELAASLRRRQSQAPPDKGGVLWAYRQIDPEHQSLWQFLDTRGRARRLAWLADERTHRSLASRLA